MQRPEFDWMVQAFQNANTGVRNYSLKERWAKERAMKDAEKESDREIQELYNVLVRVCEGIYLEEDYVYVKSYFLHNRTNFIRNMDVVPDYYFSRYYSERYRVIDIAFDVNFILAWALQKNYEIKTADVKNTMLRLEFGPIGAYYRRKKDRARIYNEWFRKTSRLHKIPFHVFKHVIMRFVCGSRRNIINKL